MTRRNIAGGIVISGTFFATFFIFAVAGSSFALLIGAGTSLVVFRLTSTTGVPTIIIRTQSSFVLSRIADRVYITFQFAHIISIRVNRPRTAGRTTIRPATGTATIPRIRDEAYGSQTGFRINPSLEREGGG